MGRRKKQNVFTVSVQFKNCSICKEDSNSPANSTMPSNTNIDLLITILQATLTALKVAGASLGNKGAVVRAHVLGEH